MRTPSLNLVTTLSELAMARAAIWCTFCFGRVHISIEMAHLKFFSRCLCCAAGQGIPRAPMLLGETELGPHIDRHIQAHRTQTAVRAPARLYNGARVSSRWFGEDRGGFVWNHTRTSRTGEARLHLTGHTQQREKRRSFNLDSLLKVTYNMRWDGFRRKINRLKKARGLEPPCDQPISTNHSRKSQKILSESRSSRENVSLRNSNNVLCS